MEVHHHTQAHAKKNWKTYFWEFLMLFLAVFCGFLAENFREHQVEHQREKQYIVSMLKELEADTAQLKIVLKDSVRVTGIDSMVRYINTNRFEASTPAGYIISKESICPTSIS
jgi:dihydroorotase